MDASNPTPMSADEIEALAANSESTKPCPRCNGEGIIWPEAQICLACDGDGELPLLDASAMKSLFALALDGLRVREAEGLQKAVGKAVVLWRQLDKSGMDELSDAVTIDFVDGEPVAFLAEGQQFTRCPECKLQNFNVADSKCECGYEFLAEGRG